MFVKSPDFEDSFKRLGLNEDAAEIATHVDGVSTASEVRPSGRVSEAEAAETLAGRHHVLAGLIARRDRCVCGA